MKTQIIFLLLILFSINAYSISLTPVKAELILDGDLEGEVKLNIGDTSSPQVKVLTNNPYVHPEQEYYDIVNGVAQPIIKYNFDYSEMKPGKHKIVIGIQPTTFSGGAAPAVGFVLNVYKPIDDYYAEASLSELRYDLGEFEGLEFKVENMGNLTIDDLYFDFTITDQYNESKSFRSDIYVLEPVSIQNIIVPIENNFEPGIYKLVGDIFYKDRSHNFKNNLYLGDVNIDILNFTNEFYSGKINNLELGIKSTWSHTFEEVTATYILKKDGNLISELKSPTVEVNGWHAKTLTGFLDLGNVEPGNYELDVRLEYSSQGEVGSSEKSFDIEVKNENKFLMFLLNNYIILLVIVLFISFLFLLRYRKEKKISATAQINCLASDKQKFSQPSQSIQRQVSFNNKPGQMDNYLQNSSANNYQRQYYSKQGYNQNYYNQYYQNYYNRYYNKRGKENENNK